MGAKLTDFPFKLSQTAAHCGPLPASADCVVIGGGIIGVMTAWALAKKGLRAVVLEKGRVAAEQSSRNWGWIRQQGRDPAEIPIMVEANAMWRQLSAEIGPELGLKQTGVLYLTDRPKGLAAYEDWMVHARAHGLDTRILTSAEVSEMAPSASKSWVAGLWTASDMRAEPWQAVPALARAAVAAGVTIVEHCAARVIDTAAGRVSGVMTEKGRIAAPSVVVAGGAWSSLFLRRHGVNIPQLSVRATAAATAPLPDVFGSPAVDETVAWRRRQDGGYTLAPGAFHDMFVGPDAFRAFRAFIPQLSAAPFGTRYRIAALKGYPDAWGTARHWSGEDVTPFEKMRILNPEPNAAQVAKIARDFAARFPSVGEVRIKAAWAGMIDTMPDIVPVLDRAPTIEGLVIATGMCGHGFGIGPAFGRLAAALVTGDAPGHDISRFRLSRFTDGSKLVLGPSL